MEEAGNRAFLQSNWTKKAGEYGQEVGEGQEIVNCQHC